MTTSAQPAPTVGPSSAWPAGRVVTVVLGSLGALVAAALLLAGVAVVLAHLTLRDSDGFYSSSTERVRTDTRALTSEGLRIGRVDGAGSDWAADLAPVRVRVRAASADGRPIFVGIAPERAVDAYLRGVAHEEVTGVHADPFATDTVRREGRARPTLPARERIWAASAGGAGTQTAEWHVDSGRWAVVVMNADGRPGVAADIAVGAEIGWLVWVGVGLLVLGLLSLVGGGVLLYVGLRPRPGRTASGGAATTGAPASSEAAARRGSSPTTR